MRTVCSRLFVYGTLRPGLGAGAAVELLHRQARYLGPATAQGRLYRVARYPGLIASDDPRDQVVGDVFELPLTGDVLDAIDAYEGFDERHPDGGEYRRVCRPVTMNYDTIDAWLYLFQREVRESDFIPTGDFARCK